ncbi:S-adenosyl-L-methionine-dependent methyltransferase [Cylindrobasidium torrendii FP15055 ss-10]|uniref:S-adenosyl-L-methionine-dependent methyltransferase n=1 Tax=Cylindrobasidium torrendii FP15055 ss-10 TaxID=1314674 RepID=A0A0D7BBX6_9AGAR|nr:S-adenosyl-L-methionine-dependent methyltransferase [Cylindrobasidium torrendii FP15055 ss-10]
MSLTALTDILSAQAKALEAAYAAAGEGVPNLDAPFHPSAIDSDPAFIQARHIIIAAANQLIQTVRPAPETLQLEACSVHSTSAIGLAEQYHLADVLAEAGPQGLHTRDIASKVGLETQSVERILRFLATRHIFKEVSPNVYVNNRISGLLQKNKPIEELRSQPNSRYAKGPLAAGVSHIADDVFASSPYLGKWLSEPGEWETPFNMSHKTHSKIFPWYGEPGNEWRMHRFASFMQYAGSLFPQDIISNSINGESLPPDSVVVDVGGSLGQATLTMYKAFPNLSYIVQDLPELEQDAKDYWKTHAPSAPVRIMPHNFFDPQPAKNAAVYFFRVVFHDWPDNKVQEIMQRTREAAGPDSKLVALDSLQEHTCRVDANSSSVVVPGAAKKTVPSPLLANLGIGGTSIFGPMDFQMWVLCNGRERTEEDFKRLGAASGWKLESVKLGAPATYTFTPA